MSRYLSILILFTTLTIIMTNCDPNCSRSGLNEIELNDSRATSNTIGIPDPTGGTCSSLAVYGSTSSGDLDYFAFDTSRINYLDIQLTGCGAGSAYITIYDSIGVQITNITTGGADYLSGTWTVDISNATRYITVVNNGCLRNYTLQIDGR